MAEELRFQDPGEGIRDGEVREIPVSPGDSVEDGDVVLVVETDKAAFEVASPYTGTVAEVAVSEGDEISVGDLLMTFETGAGAQAKETDREDAAEETEGGAEEPPSEAEEREEPEEEEPEPEPDEEEKEEKGEDGAARAKETEKGREREPAETAEAKPTPSRERGGEPVPATPAVRALARERGVDLAAISGSGRGGRVTREDVEAAAGGQGGGAGEGERRPRRARRPYELPDFEQWGPVERVPLRSIRRATARQTARAWAEIPHVTHTDEADVTELEQLQARHADAVREAGGKLTLTAFVLKAVAGALATYPRFNASLDADAEELILKQYVNVSVAVDTEAGLLMPAVRDVDRKTLTQVAVELTAIAEEARAGKLSREAMQGGTFSVSNVGPLGGLHFTPVIYHPQVALLGMGRTRWVPVVREINGTGLETVPRRLLPLSLAYDHRVIDGAEAARFMTTLVDSLHDAESYAMMV